MSNLFTFFCFLLTSFSFAATDFATVVTVKGKATKLLPGAMSAKIVKVGDKVPQDTSLVTGKRSYVILRLSDDSKVTVGPKSKMVLSYSANESGSILSLLKGRLRTKVEKNKNKSLYITTRTAALGVRGTEFQTIYNPENKMTNLLTFNGEVAMAKIKEEDIKYKNKTSTKYQRTRDNEVKVIKTNYKVPVIGTDEVEDLINKRAPEVVKAGQFSVTVGAHQKVSKPVKISPVQLTLLYANKTMENSERPIRRDIADAKGLGLLPQADQVAPLEGYYDKNTGDYAPKSGGVIDMSTGLYVPPGKNSVFDERKGVYVAKSVGDLDSVTGDYVSPKGLALDPKKGFVVSKNSKISKGEFIKLKAISKALNNEMKTDVIISKDNKKIEAKYDPLTLRERFSKDHLLFSFGAYDLEVDEQSNSLTSNNAETFNDASFVELQWLLRGNGKYRPRLGLGIRGTGNNNGNKRYVKPGNQLFSLSVGLDYYLSSRLFLSSLVEIREELVPDYDSSNLRSANLAIVTLNNVKLGVQYDIAYVKKFHFYTNFYLKTNFHKTDSAITVKNGFGFDARVGTIYHLSRSHQLNLSLFLDEQFFDVRNNDYFAEITNREVGLSFQYGYSF